MTAQSLTDCTVLSNGVQMPWFGLGVFKMKDDGETEAAVLAALEAGYRSIDTAAAYRNEVGVGNGIRKSGVAREDIFLTTKVWNADQGYETSLAAFDNSLKLLGFDYVDLLLVHWPVKGKYRDTWRALEKIYKDGKARAIGVSNFQVHHLEDLFEDCEIKPMVNQVEYHPLLQQPDVRPFCRNHGIQLEAWSPLMQGNLDNSVLTEIGAKYGKSAAQVILRWDIQNEVVTIPKTVTPSRMKENADIFDFELSTEDMALIAGLNENRRFGSDPDNFNF